ncbi:MAG TPA: hypothetical protein VLE99_04100 [Candidatus Saccharimonadales bacterium]|nr:hypothetical protein [Candidatus Saccharimonadales bacterium]
MNIELGADVWYSADVKGYAMLRLPDLEPRAITFAGVQLAPKAEYHCSILAARKLAQGDAEKEHGLVEAVRLWLSQNALTYNCLNGEVHVCRRRNEAGEEEMTVVAGVVVDGLAALHAALQKDFPEVPALIPHATVLKSANSPYGIGVNSAEDLAAYCEPHPKLFTQIFASA